VEDPHNTGAADTFLYREPELLEIAGDYSRGAVLCEREFRVAMKIFVHLNQL
jgi:hypothetical protein